MSDYVPALGLRSLTRFYDPVIAATTREATFKGRLLDQVDLSLFFHHLDREVKAETAAEIRRVLAPGGELQRLRTIFGSLSFYSAWNP